MKRIKQLLAMVVSAILLITGMPLTAFAETANPFTDVREGKYFYEPVLWAVENNVTTGTSATTFSPDSTCTRGQVVTFLWRASGQPEPELTKNPFRDVKSGGYYYKAVLWAVENGITSGVSETEFAPDDFCTRGQVVTFQWRSGGRPDPEAADNPFTDVKDRAYYYKAVLWAVEKKITSGVSATGFAPDDACTRGQIVTFLYRQMGIDEDLDAEEYFNKHAEVLSVTDVEKSEEIPTEAQADSLLEDRGFTDEVLTEYDMNGEFLEEERIISADSVEEHPMYYSYYVTETGDIWTVIITEDRVMAYPATYNMESGNEVITVVSEEDSIVNYDVIDNAYYEMIPDEDTVIVKKVKKINAETLEELSKGEFHVEKDAESGQEPTLVENLEAEANRFSAASNGGSENGPVVVSMGDSYSSGEGNPDFIGWTGDLKSSVKSHEFLSHRSKNSWASQLVIDDVKMENNRNWYFSAVSGAETKDMDGRQSKKIKFVDLPDQLSLAEQLLPLSELKKKYTVSDTASLERQYDILEALREQRTQVDYVTLTLGGNDVDFVGIVMKLFSGVYDGHISWGSFESKLESKKTYFENALRYDLKTVYTSIARKTNFKADIIVAGYPRLFDENGKGPAGITKKRSKMLNDTVTYFNDRIEDLVQKTANSGYKISFVDVEGSESEGRFWGRGAYSDKPAINEIKFGARKQDLDQDAIASSYSIHPNKDGIEIYRDCVQKEINRIEREKEQNSDFTGNTGEYITFGSYEQDNDLENGKEPIEWLVLKKENGKALLLSKYGLDCQQYNDNIERVTWETCTLRKWLNTTFLNEAFSSSERSRIPTMTIQNPDTYTGTDGSEDYIRNNTGNGITELYYRVAGGNPTNDQVFLLSIDEAKRMLGYEAKTLYETDGSGYTIYPNMQASLTAYAKAQGAWADSYYTTAEGRACWWWLRSLGGSGKNASYISFDGSVNCIAVSSDSFAVRPAMWIDLYR